MYETQHPGGEGPELRRAKQSQKRWSAVGRTWDYQELLSVLKDRDAPDALANRLTEKGFFVLHAPAELAEDAQQRLVSQSVVSDNDICLK